MKKIINASDLDSLKKMLTLIDSEQSTFSESCKHLNQCEKMVKKKEEESLQKKVLEKKK